MEQNQTADRDSGSLDALVSRASLLRERASRSRRRAENARLHEWLYLIKSANSDEAEAAKLESAANS